MSSKSSHCNRKILKYDILEKKKNDNIKEND